MQNIINIPKAKPSRLERFGLFYLDLFKRLDTNHSVFDLTDAQITKRTKRITWKGIILSSIVGIVCVFPTVWVDVYFENKPWYVHYGWVTVVTILLIVIEFYLLFIIALKAVYQVSKIINIHATEDELVENELFSVKNILARAALELPDPELKILGIDPFKRVNKKNLLVLGLLYKAKILLTNLVSKYALRLISDKTIFGVSILYEALFVEAFWNGVVIVRVIKEARLRLFGFALANKIALETLNENDLQQLSPLAKVGCLRAIGNAVVMTKNYHPNMIILLFRFQQMLHITKENKYDDWNLFLETLNTVSEKERNFLLDLFTVSAAFDGKLSDLEEENLKTVYGKDYGIYHPRLVKLTACLKEGKLNEALSLCKLDFVVG
jgi:hypothetical protein